MNNIPVKLKKQLLADPEYKHCALKGLHECGGRITLEHAIIYAGKQVQARWAIIPVCAAGQDVDQYQDSHRMNKEMNRWVALNRATDDELRAISKATDYLRERARLNTIYGPYRLVRTLPQAEVPSVAAWVPQTEALTTPYQLALSL